MLHERRIGGDRSELLYGGIQVFPAFEEPMTVMLNGGNVSPEGVFDIEDVSPGLYTLSFRSATATGTAQVEVRGADTYVEIAPVRNGALHGRILVRSGSQSTSALPPVQARLVSAESTVEMSYAAKITRAGDFNIDNVPAGKYYLKFTCGSGFYVHSIVAGGTDVFGGILTISGGIPTESVIELREGLAIVSGAIEQLSDTPDHQSPRNPLRIVFIPVGCRMAIACGISFGASDASGRFSAASIRPGKYKVLALPSLDPDLLQNPAGITALSNSGVDLDVPEGGIRDVKLRAITGADLDRLFSTITSVSE